MLVRLDVDEAARLVEITLIREGWENVAKYQIVPSPGLKTMGRRVLAH